MRDIAENNGQITMFGGGSQVRYLSEQERDAFKLIIRDGKFYAADGFLFDTRDASSVFRGGVGHAIFVMEKDGTFYASKYQSVGEFHHSNFVAGRPVAAAGEIGVVDGTLISLSDRSGHYRPGREFTDQALVALQSAGVDLSTVSSIGLKIR